MAQIASFRKTLGSGTVTEDTAFEHRMMHDEGRLTVAALSASTNTRVRIKYVFDNAGGAEQTESDIQTLDLTQNVLTLVNFDFHAGLIRVTYDDNGSSMSGGDLKIDAHVG